MHANEGLPCDHQSGERFILGIYPPIKREECTPCFVLFIMYCPLCVFFFFFFLGGCFCQGKQAAAILSYSIVTDLCVWKYLFFYLLSCEDKFVLLALSKSKAICLFLPPLFEKNRLLSFEYFLSTAFSMHWYTTFSLPVIGLSSLLDCNHPILTHSVDLDVLLTVSATFVPYMGTVLLN